MQTNNATSSQSVWQWDKGYRRYWRYKLDSQGQYVRDNQGQYVCIWQPEEPASSSAQTGTLNDGSAIAETSTAETTKQQSIADRRDSKSGFDYDPNMAPPAPEEIKGKLAFKGTPERGWYELDDSYRMRTRAEERAFFKPGRVFAMLWSETASDTISGGTENTKYTKHNGMFPGAFGQGVYCSIRRFVIVRVARQHYVEACAITTYNGRGVLKRGCNPAEHTIVYLSGCSPVALPGEIEAGMVKTPLMIVPTLQNEEMGPISRLRLGKIYSIECNVKVRDIGMIADRTTLLRLHREARNDEFDNVDDEEFDAETPRPSQRPLTRNYDSNSHGQGHGAPFYGEEHGQQSRSNSNYTVSTSYTYAPNVQAQAGYSSYANYPPSSDQTHPRTMEGYTDQGYSQTPYPVQHNPQSSSPGGSAVQYQQYPDYPPQPGYPYQ